MGTGSHPLVGLSLPQLHPNNPSGFHPSHQCDFQADPHHPVRVATGIPCYYFTWKQSTAEGPRSGFKSVTSKEFTAKVLQRPKASQIPPLSSGPSTLQDTHTPNCSHSVPYRILMSGVKAGLSLRDILFL